MSRSRQKRPFLSHHKDNRQSEKEDKRIANHALRQAFKQAMHKDPELSIPPLIREVSDRYNFKSDGGRYWGEDLKYPRWDEYHQEFKKWYGPEALAKRMRK